MPVLDLPDSFVDSWPGTGLYPAKPVFLSGFELNQIRDAVEMLDQLSYRARPAWDSLGSPDTAAIDDYATGGHHAADYRLSWGSVMVLAGMTTITATGTSANANAGTSIVLLINGTQVTTTSATSTWTLTWTITGVSVGDVVGFEIRTSGNTVKNSQHVVYEVYGSPVSNAGGTTWPGSLTLTSGLYPAAALNQLLQMCQYLFDRINSIPMVLPGNRFMYRQGTHRLPDYPLYTGTVLRTMTTEILRLVAIARVLGNVQTGLRLTYNGSVVSNPTNWVAGQTYTLSVPVTLTHTIGTRALIQIDEDVTTGNQPANVNTRWDILVVGSEPPSSGPPVATIPSPFPVNGLIAPATLTSRLQGLSDTLTAIKARLDARPEAWNRVMAFRRRFAQTDGENTKLAPVYVPRQVRTGEKLIVRGKNVKINWGGIALPTKDDKIDYDGYTFTHSEQLVDGDKVDTKIVNFDQFAGLFRGTLYTLTGDLLWAGEYVGT